MIEVIRTSIKVMPSSDRTALAEGPDHADSSTVWGG